MPQVRKLTDREVHDLGNKGKGQRKLVEEQYDALLGGFDLGDWGEVDLEPGENRLTVRNRVKAAARRRAFAVAFNRTGVTLLRFKIVAAGAPAKSAAPEVVAVSTPAPAPVAAPKRRGGRPKKAV